MHAEFSYNKASISILHRRNVLVEQCYKPVKTKKNLKTLFILPAVDMHGQFTYFSTFL